MDELLATLPPYLLDNGGKAWLTLATWADGWQAAYIDCEGYAMNSYNGIGKTPVEALLDLKESIDLLHLLNAPSGQIE